MCILSFCDTYGFKLSDPSTLNFSTKEAMMLGTAGMTAGLAILSIADKLTLNKSKAVVSGATGGVGSIAVYLLNLNSKIILINL